MHPRRAATSLAIALAIGAAVFTACPTQQSREARFIGKWQHIVNLQRGVIEFSEGGRVTLTAHGEEVSGNWTLLQDGTARIELKETGVFIGRIDGNFLRLDMEGKGEYGSFRRVST